MSVCLFLLAGGLLASAFAGSIGALAAARAMSGLAAGATIPLAIAIIGDRFALEDRQRALSRYLLFVIVGQMSGAPMAGVLAEWVGWRPVFVIAAAIALLAAICVRIGIRPRPDAARPPFSAAQIIRTTGSSSAIRWRSIATARWRPRAASSTASCPMWPPCWRAAALAGVREAGFVVAGIGVGGLLFNLALGPLQRAMSRAAIMRAGGVVIMAGMAGVAVAQSWPLETGAFTVVGLGFYMLHTGIQTEATELAPTARGSAVSLHAFSLFLGMAVGPVVYGAAIPVLGAPLAVLLGGSAVMAAGFMIGARVADRGG